MNKKLLFGLTIALFIFSLFNCYDDYDVIYNDFYVPELKAELQIPVYKNYQDFSEFVNNQLSKDFEKYKNYALTEWEVYQDDTLTYRTVFKDLSTTRYINVFISKFIFCGPEMEDEYYISFSYDKKNKKILNIEEVTGMSTSELIVYCKTELKKKIREFENIDKYTIRFLDSCLDLKFSSQKNFAFSVKNNKVNIFFAPGDILPKNYGSQCIEFKR